MKNFILKHKKALSGLLAVIILIGVGVSVSNQGLTLINIGLQEVPLADFTAYEEETARLQEKLDEANLALQAAQTEHENALGTLETLQTTLAGADGAIAIATANRDAALAAVATAENESLAAPDNVELATATNAAREALAAAESTLTLSSAGKTQAEEDLPEAEANIVQTADTLAVAQSNAEAAQAALDAHLATDPGDVTEGSSSISSEVNEDNSSEDSSEDNSDINSDDDSDSSSSELTQGAAAVATQNLFEDEEAVGEGLVEKIVRVSFYNEDREAILVNGKTVTNITVSQDARTVDVTGIAGSLPEQYQNAAWLEDAQDVDLTAVNFNTTAEENVFSADLYVKIHEVTFYDSDENIIDVAIPVASNTAITVFPQGYDASADWLYDHDNNSATARIPFDITTPITTDTHLYQPEVYTIQFENPTSAPGSVSGSAAGWNLADWFVMPEEWATVEATAEVLEDGSITQVYQQPNYGAALQGPSVPGFISGAAVGASGPAASLNPSGVYVGFGKTDSTDSGLAGANSPANQYTFNYELIGWTTNADMSWLTAMSSINDVTSWQISYFDLQEDIIISPERVDENGVMKLYPVFASIYPTVSNPSDGAYARYYILTNSLDQFDIAGDIFTPRDISSVAEREYINNFIAYNDNYAVPVSTTSAVYADNIQFDENELPVTINTDSDVARRYLQDPSQRPSDAAVFDTINQRLNLTGDEAYTTVDYGVYWYVLKPERDSYHIDGVIYKKIGTVEQTTAGVYNGNEYTASVQLELPPGLSLDDYRVEYRLKGSDAEWSDTAPSRTDAGTDVYEYRVVSTAQTSNHVFAVGEVSIEVSKRPLVLQGRNLSKEDDGTPLLPESDEYDILDYDEATQVGITAAEDAYGLLNDNTLQSVEVTGEQTEVGSSEYILSNAVILERATGSEARTTIAEAEEQTSNYEITYLPGTLELFEAPAVDIPPEEVPDENTPEEPTPEIPIPETNEPEDTEDEPTAPEEGEDEPATPEEGEDEPATPEEGEDEPAAPEGAVDEPAAPEGAVDEPAAPEEAEDEPTETDAPTPDATTPVVSSAIPVVASANVAPNVTTENEPATPTQEERFTNIPQAFVPLAQALENVELEIGNTVIPLASFGGSWALLNLLLAVATALLCVSLLVSYFVRKKHPRKEQEQEKAQEHTHANTDHSDSHTKRKGILRIGSLVVALIAVILFILTQDMSLPMAVMDEWTLWMLVIFVVQLMITILSRKKAVKNEEKKPEHAR